MIVIIDNYDSFTYNLYQYVGEFYENIKVFRNDEISIEKLEKLDIKGIIISPGPGKPKDAGISIDVIKNFYKKIPILGICLGHQAIGEAFKGEIIKCKEICHGKKSIIAIKGKDIFSGVKRRTEVMRYHSLCISKNNFPKDLEIIAETLDKEIVMAIKHKDYPIYGVQFHPESVGTDDGNRIIGNFILDICKVNF